MCIRDRLATAGAMNMAMGMMVPSSISATHSAAAMPVSYTHLLQQMESLGSDRVRLEFRMPSRGLFGYRNQFLTRCV